MNAGFRNPWNRYARRARRREIENPFRQQATLLRRESVEESHRNLRRGTLATIVGFGCESRGVTGKRDPQVRQQARFEIEEIETRDRWVARDFRRREDPKGTALRRCELRGVKTGETRIGG